jgi:hypothetical protein
VQGKAKPDFRAGRRESSPVTPSGLGHRHQSEPISARREWWKNPVAAIGGKVSATDARFAASYEWGAAERTMKPRLLIGLMGVVLLVMPSVVAAQRGVSGGFAASGMRVGAVSSGGAPYAASVVRTSSNVSNVVPVSPSVVHARASVYAADVPSRHAGMSSALRTQNAGGHVFAPVGPPNRRRNPPPVTTPVSPPRVVYILGVGGYYYGAPGDESAGAPQDAAQDAAEVEGQLADDQQPGGANDRDGERDGERADNRDDGQTEASAAPRSPELQEAEQQEPLPDVGTLTLVLRDGSRLDVVAFTMTQGQVIYITPEGRRLSIAAEIFDADATQRVNQERGTPMQLPL